MSAVPTVARIDVARRQRCLRALGVQPLVLRARPAVAPVAALPVASGPGPRCVLVLPREGASEPRQRRQVDALLAAIGLHGDAVHWLVIEDGNLAGEPPCALAYLALGRHAARALGMALPAAVRDAALVAVTDTAPADWLQQPGQRREAWLALRPLRLALRRAG